MIASRKDRRGRSGGENRNIDNIMNSVARKSLDSRSNRQSAIIKPGSGAKFRLQRVSRISNPLVFSKNHDQGTLLSVVTQ